MPSGEKGDCVGFYRFQVSRQKIVDDRVSGPTARTGEGLTVALSHISTCVCPYVSKMKSATQTFLNSSSYTFAGRLPADLPCICYVGCGS